MESLLQVENLTFRYPGAEKNAVEDVSFSLAEGEFAVLAGASGSGKTTLLKLLKRELKPFGEKSGGVFYRGESDPTTEIGFIFQDPEAGIVTDKVWHELAFGVESLGLPNEEIRRRVAEMAAYFGLEHLFRKSTADLSGGEKQLVNLASVLAMRPKLLLLDEPTAFLDPIAKTAFLNTIRKINRETGLTVLLAEHALEEALPAADRFFIMDGGRLAFSGAPREALSFFRAHPGHPVYESLPAAMRIYHETANETDGEADGRTGTGLPPMTVREGRAYLDSRGFFKAEMPSGPETATETTPVLELKDVWFRYEKDGKDVLRGLTLPMYEGEHFALLGGNGAGKSTALKVLAGILKPFRGKVAWQGKTRPEIAYLPQNPETVFVKNTLREELPDEAYAASFGLAGLLDQHPNDLSGGEKERAALAKVLISKPKVLLLDEPTKGLDGAERRKLVELVRKLTGEGTAVLTVTHDVEFAASSADTCALLFDGEICGQGTPRDFFSGNPFYTTAANRISRRDDGRGLILPEEVVEELREA